MTLCLQHHLIIRIQSGTCLQEKLQIVMELCDMDLHSRIKAWNPSLILHGLANLQGGGTLRARFAHSLVADAAAS